MDLVVLCTGALDWSVCSLHRSSWLMCVFYTGALDWCACSTQTRLIWSFALLSNVLIALNLSAISLLNFATWTLIFAFFIFFSKVSRKKQGKLLPHWCRCFMKKPHALIEYLLFQNKAESQPSGGTRKKRQVDLLCLRPVWSIEWARATHRNPVLKKKKKERKEEFLLQGKYFFASVANTNKKRKLSHQMESAMGSSLTIY